MAAEADKVWDVAIVGSGFAGALIAHELGKGRKNVIILEAGAGVPPNFNAYMRRFYSAAAKVPERRSPPGEKKHSRRFRVSWSMAFNCILFRIPAQHSLPGDCATCLAMEIQWQPRSQCKVTQENSGYAN